MEGGLPCLALHDDHIFCLHLINESHRLRGHDHLRSRGALRVRRADVVVPDFFEASWIPIGRDLKLEQVILDRLSRLDVTVPCR